MLVKVFKHALSLRQNKFSAEVLSIVSASFPQKPFSVACQEERHTGWGESKTTFINAENLRRTSKKCPQVNKLLLTW